jgi:hypothetical protein
MVKCLSAFKALKTYKSWPGNAEVLPKIDFLLKKQEPD